MDLSSSNMPRGTYPPADRHPSPTITTVGSRRSKTSSRVKRLTPRNNGAISCKTCIYCRTRKSRCDGTRPQCSSCAAAGHDCIYPEDARRLNRPTRADVEVLEAQIASLRNLLQRRDAAHCVAGSRHDASPYPDPEPCSIQHHSCSSVDSAHDIYDTTLSPDQYSLAGPSVSNRMPNGHTPQSDHGSITHSHSYLPNKTDKESSEIRERVDANASVDMEADAGVDAGPSPFEADVAGVIRQDGDLVVHGVSSIFHQLGHTKKPSSLADPASMEERKQRNQISKARLIANAALLRQRESILLRAPSINKNVDFDGLDPELAIHLLDLHWNRQHYTYLISYRPAIMDSLMSNGPYVNTLLLNSIYFSSSLLSDRVEVRSDPADPQSAGVPFYDRFRTLLVDNIDKPSIPTSVALLLCGATLVSHGKPSAGWIMCGIAYRMIIDLGCHLVLDPRRCSANNQTELLTDVELEMRKRLYWGAFLTDVTQSLYFGRPPCLRASQARVPQLLLDTYEELDDWTPYIDPLIPPGLPPYGQPRPAYAITTFNSMIRLFSIASKIVHSLYSIKSLKDSRQHIKTVKTAAESELEQWIASLPSHLQFDPETDSVPPPHQVAPFTTYHTLRILLQRPFLENGHLYSGFQDDDRQAGEHICVDAALSIWRFVRAYKAAFTLRRAPYLISYSVYSAVVAILNQRLVEHSHFTECMKFFWSALIDLQQGCNFGLQKPLDILRDVVAQFGKDIPKSTDQVGQVTRNFMRLEKGDGLSYNGTSTGHRDYTHHSNPQGLISDSRQQDSFPFWGPDQFGTSAENDDWSLNDTLYGLFTPANY
ncbi:fungal-specific transcription factor domain-containing protein [Xylogone sp. PMI_703]|nr:fungal-specific transcription factor domain-containing protein [Xylogone sp. PMI_703]